MELAKVKHDLRVLRKVNHGLDAQKEMKTRYELQLKSLTSSKFKDDFRDEIARAELMLDKLEHDINDYSLRAMRLEELYADAINKLEPLLKAVIIKGYVSGTARYKIANELGYSSENVKKLSNVAIEKIAELIQE